MYHSEPETFTETYVTEKNGIEYSVIYKINKHCIRPGNHSSIAQDPDEYYGEYRYEYNGIVSVEAYNSKKDTEWEINKIPTWIEKEVEAQVDSYN
jgi:hypothetical protein